MGKGTEALREKTLKVHQRLLEVYGEPEHHHMDAVSEMVNTILSQNTNDRLRDIAFNRLREKFPTWEDVRDAPVEEIEDAIRIAGLGGQKSVRIKGALQRLTEERGSISLEFLRKMPVEDAREWLISFNGIGPKTAAIILLFSLDMPAFPVDTHVHRISKRLGLIGPKVNREKAQGILEKLVPSELYYTFHLNLIRHGREICSARKPKCEICVLRDLCDYYARSAR